MVAGVGVAVVALCVEAVAADRRDRANVEIVEDRDQIGRDAAHLAIQFLRRFDADAVLTQDIWGYLWGKLAYSSLLYAQGLAEAGIADRACVAKAFPAQVPGVAETTP